MIFMYLELSFRYQKFDFRHFKKTVAGMLTPLFQSLYISDLHIFFYQFVYFRPCISQFVYFRPYISQFVYFTPLILEFFKEFIF